MSGPSRTPPSQLVCYLVTDTGMCGGPDGVVRVVEQAVAAGATCVQVRDPDCSDDDFVALARRVVAAVAGRVPVVLNDRVHLVAAAGADGAHIGQGDLDPVVARELLGPDAVLGLSVQTREHVTAAMALPSGTIDHLGIGPVWGQQTKLDAAPPGGPELLVELVELSPWPCVAIGGIGPGRGALVRQAGAGMAIVSAICAADDPGLATREMLEEWNDDDAVVDRRD